MKTTSEQYKREMLEPWRGSWLINLYIGIIKELFQNTAIGSPISPLSFLSNNYNQYLFNDSIINDNVATFEKNLIKANGTYIFTDEKHTNVGVPFYGVISEEVSRETNELDFSISFKSKENIVGLGGLTLYFFETYPTLFDIIVKDTGTIVYQKEYTNDSLIFSTSDNFSDIGNELILVIKKMNKPYVRFRLSYVLFGVGINFTNNDFLEAGGSYSSFMHPRSIELPTQSLSLQIDNYENRFDFDKKGSLINLMQSGQDISLQIGYRKEDGEVEYLSKDTMELSNFDMQNNSLKINAIDFLSNQNNMIVFDDPSFFKAGTTLYEVAQEVIKQFKNTSFEIILDDALRSIPMKFRKIEISVKEALMMIASASRCVMEFTPKGLYIRRKEVKYVAVESESINSSPYSDNIITNSEIITLYGTFEKDKFKANGLSKFAPKTISTYKTGYVSDAISDKDGLFNKEVSFIIKSDEGISPSNLTINFYDTTVKKIVIKTYFNNVLKETLEYDEINSSTFSELHDYIAFDKMVVEIKEILEPFNRVYVSYATFSDFIYNVNKEVVIENLPKGGVLDSIRDIYVNYGYASKEEDGYLDIENQIKISCNQMGSDIEYDNPFVTYEDVAIDVAMWLRDYYESRIEYEMNWLGDPSLEVNDIISIPNDFNKNGIVCDIETNTINFTNGGINGRIIARREQDNVARTKNKLD